MTPAAGPPGMAGFTLVEVIVALTISSVLIVLVSTTFLVQNRYYELQLARASTQDVARSTTSLVAEELRSTVVGGVTVAAADSLVVRSPMAIGAVCGSRGGSTYAYFDGGGTRLDGEEVAGFAVRDSTTGSWSFHSQSWTGVLDGGTRDAADECAAVGADTVGARDHFLRLHMPSGQGGQPSKGQLIMLFRETSFAFRESALERGTYGFYRGAAGDTLVEYASGLDTTVSFAYRRSSRPGFSSSVSGSSRDSIDAVRIVARSRRAVAAGGSEDVVFGWTVDVPLRNVP